MFLYPVFCVMCDVWCVFSIVLCFKCDVIEHNYQYYMNLAIHLSKRKRLKAIFRHFRLSVMVMVLNSASGVWICCGFTFVSIQQIPSYTAAPLYTMEDTILPEYDRLIQHKTEKLKIKFLKVGMKRYMVQGQLSLGSAQCFIHAILWKQKTTLKQGTLREMHPYMMR